MKNILNIQNYFLPGKLESEIASLVAYYILQRSHESLDNLTPADGALQSQGVAHSTR
jgi:hypothetical protein